MAATTTPVARMKGDTSKAKPQLAVDLGIALSDLEAKSILWVPVPIDTATKYMLSDACEARNLGNVAGDGKRTLKSFALVSDMALAAIEAAREELTKEASVIARKTAEDKTPEELNKEMLVVQRKMDAIKAALKAKMDAATEAAKAAAVKAPAKK